MVNLGSAGCNYVSCGGGNSCVGTTFACGGTSAVLFSVEADTLAKKLHLPATGIRVSGELSVVELILALA